MLTCAWLKEWSLAGLSMVVVMPEEEFERGNCRHLAIEEGSDLLFPQGGQIVYVVDDGSPQH